MRTYAKTPQQTEKASVKPVPAYNKLKYGYKPAIARPVSTAVRAPVVYPVRNQVPSNRNVTPWEVGWHWLTGTHPQDWHFRDGDLMTVELMKSEGMVKARSKAVLAARACCSLEPQAKSTGAGDLVYGLNGIIGVWKFIRDASAMATFGLTGNLTVAFTGSYNGTWTVDLNCCSGMGNIHFSVKNVTGLTSGTRFPVLGYDGVKRPSVGDWLVDPLGTVTEYGATLPGSIVHDIHEGPMANSTQYFNWSEPIFFRPPAACSAKTGKTAKPAGHETKPKAGRHKLRASVGSISWIDPASPAGLFVSDPQPAARITTAQITGGSGFRFSNYLESWIETGDGIHIADHGLDSRSGQYGSPSLMNIPSHAFPTIRYQRTITKDGVQGVEHTQIVGSRTVSAGVIGGAVGKIAGSRFGVPELGKKAGTATANLLTNFPPIWTVLRLRHFANGVRSGSRVSYSYFPSNDFYLDLDLAARQYNAHAREETMWEIVGWGAGNPWGASRPTDQP